MRATTLKAHATSIPPIWLPPIAAFAVLGLAGLVVGGGPSGGTRLPLQKSAVEIKTPGPVPKEIIGYKDGQPIYYDPQPRIDPLGDGRYAFRWIGAQGRRLTVIYQRPDMVDVVVEASVLVAPGGFRYRYRYRVKSLRSSKQNLAGFAVQTFSPSAQAERAPGLGAEQMSNSAAEFRDGRWILFGILEDQKAVRPGQEVVVTLSSPDPPGIVRCRAYGGSLGLKGVGEEMPTALENAIPGYEIWPRGFTIGPDERLGKVSMAERLASVVRFLPEMQRQGWIRDLEIVKWYRDGLNAGKVAEVRARAQKDFDKGLVTGEVLALLTP